MPHRIRTWLLLMAALALCGQAIHLYPGVCNRDTKTCGVHPQSDNGLNNMAYFLVGAGRTEFKDGWTLLVNPCNEACDITNCSVASSDTPPCSGASRYAYINTPFRTNLNNITIKSYYDDTPVYVAMTQATGLAQASMKTSVITAGRPITCVWGVFIGAAIAVHNFEYTITDECRAIAATAHGIVASATSPIVLLSADATNSYFSQIQVHGADAIVSAYPSTDQVTINLDGSVFGPSLTQDEDEMSVFGTDAVVLNLNLYRGAVVANLESTSVVLHVAGELNALVTGTFTNFNNTVYTGSSAAGVCRAIPVVVETVKEPCHLLVPILVVGSVICIGVIMAVGAWCRYHTHAISTTMHTKYVRRMLEQDKETYPPPIVTGRPPRTKYQ